MVAVCEVNLEQYCTPNPRSCTTRANCLLNRYRTFAMVKPDAILRKGEKKRVFYLCYKDTVTTWSRCLSLVNCTPSRRLGPFNILLCPTPDDFTCQGEAPRNSCMKGLMFKFNYIRIKLCWRGLPKHVFCPAIKGRNFKCRGLFLYIGKIGNIHKAILLLISMLFI